ncbi:PREDICTED: cytochrome c oxidase subunit 6A1, mitochondrial-like [Papilio xuthus]|uniref:Cytochrome c oxidase subunit n=1 Tax=Papilio xuthus TaxID=66420 RepID=A0A194PQB4_PAPXU|nr:PREDICTED: cytochrome c oxidase subunit 6A1, mitochondrial-like [Papilio xuthus]KPI95636.1 Cytochrome c oxidase subunit 6A1, mitochondrial [Papilio xuthus]
MASILQRAATLYLQNQARAVSHSATAGGHGGGYKLWKKLTFFVAFPAVGLGMLNAYLAHQEEHHERPPFIPYDYMRVRTKRFPWGDGQKTLFHNPHVNALPTGYEDEH